MRVLVAGGLGFIGSHLVDRLVSNHEVVVVDNLSAGSMENRNGLADYFYIDISEYCEKYTNDFDIIFHLANHARVNSSFDKSNYVLKNNINTTLDIIEYAKENNSKLIYASSSTTLYLDRENNPYTTSKHMCNDLIKLSRRETKNHTMVMFFNVYGSDRESDETVIKIFKNNYKLGLPLTIIGDGTKVRDFTHIDDTIDALESIIQFETFLESYQIGSGEVYSIYDIAKEFNHPIKFIEEREYEHNWSLSKSNVVGYKAHRNLLKHIKEFINKD